MRKGYIKVIAAIATLCLALFGFAACAKAPAVGGGDGGGDDDDPNYGDGSKLASVAVDSIVSTETINQNNGNYVIRLEWAAADKASSYKVKCNGTQLTDVTTAAVSVSRLVMTMPSNGKFSFEIVSAGPGYVDSDPTRYSYSAEGVQLNSPEITSFENGTLKWKAVPGAPDGYIVSVGERGGAKTDAHVTGTEYKVDADSALSGKALSVSISVAGDGVYKKTSDTVHLNVNAAHTKLTMSPVTDYTVTDGVLSWAAVGGAKGYRVVDIENNSRVITATEYDVSDKQPVYGVFPVSSSALISDAEIERVDIPYLKGDGTKLNPYVISTPFELRMIDYYEALYADDIKTNASLAPLNYFITDNIDYNSVSVPEGVSNLYSMSKPFYGDLDGNGKTLRNIRVRYASGYWALFDFIAPGAKVHDLKIDAADIENELANLTNPTYPIGATIAAIAYENYGRISNIALTDAKFTATGGEVSGIATHNCKGGIVENCSVGGTFKQKATGQESQACYEMAGVVLENYGTVQNNILTDLTIEGSVALSKDKDENGNPYKYNCVRSAGGIVSVNRKGGVVKNNSYTRLTMKTILTDTVQYEEGGIVAYNAGTVTRGTGTLGTFTFNGKAIPADAINGKAKEKDTDLGWVGKLVGKNDGTATA